MADKLRDRGGTEMLGASSITLHQTMYEGAQKNGSIQSANFSSQNLTGWQIDYTGIEKNSGYIDEIKSRYGGLQEDLSFLLNHSCGFLCICSIIEEVNGKPIDDLLRIIREVRSKGLICEHGVKNMDYTKILEMYTDKKWSFRILPKSPERLCEKDFLIECHFVPEQIKPIDDTHFYKIEQSFHARRIFSNGTKLDPSRSDNLLDDVSAAKVYVVFSYE